jgi:hypothetical protein
LLAVIIQQLKGDYRLATRLQGKEAGLQTFVNLYESRSKTHSLFSMETLAPSTVRINQGFIITYIMKTVPHKVPFSEGEELKQILEAAFLPRIIAPNKLVAGDRNLFMKYTGLVLNQGTSMGLSSVGDAYLNFGVWGGCIFMFILGFLYSEVLKQFDRAASKNFPILILFTALVFYYPIRPDSEFQTILGHLVKSCFFLWVIFKFWKEYFKEAPTPLKQEAPAPILATQ